MVFTRSRWPALALVAAIVLAAGAAPLAARQPPRPADEEFVPIDQLPADEKLPAAPLVIAAYAVAWVVVAVYLWSIRQRLARVEREMGDVARRIAHGAAPGSGGAGGGGQPRAGGRERP